MYQDGKIWIGQAGEESVYIYPKMANRHGLIAGATGTGKTVTLKVMAESFSSAGVPVFLADVKGDLSGMCMPGENQGTVAKKIEELNLFSKGFNLNAYPVSFWDVYGEKGNCLRTTVTEMGPLLLSRVMNLNDTQSDLLSIIFKIADDRAMPLLDTKDLKALINDIAENTSIYSAKYGNMTKNSLNVLIRGIVALETEGGEEFFAEPALNYPELMVTSYDGKGKINILDCQKLINNPRMYTSFMLWLVSELYESLPEVGDLDKPKMVFFFDEAHMLFENASKILLEKIEQIVKLIRSKGVGIYFITQNPSDIPDGVLAQLGNKVQHALRAYTPKELKGAKIAAESFRVNPEFDTFTVLGELGVGQALVSVLDEKGIPTIVQKTSILPPQSFMGVVDEDTRQQYMANDPLNAKYADIIDRVSAYEMLTSAMQTSIVEEEVTETTEVDPQKAELEARLAELEAQLAAQANASANAQSTLGAYELSEEEYKALTPKQKAEYNKAKRKAASEGVVLPQTAAAKAETQKKKEDANAKAYKKAAKSVGQTASGTIGREVGNAIGGSFGKFGKKLGGNVGASLGRNIFGTLFR